MLSFLNVLRNIIYSLNGYLVIFQGLLIEITNKVSQFIFKSLISIANIVQ